MGADGQLDAEKDSLLEEIFREIAAVEAGGQGAISESFGDYAEYLKEFELAVDRLAEITKVDINMVPVSSGLGMMGRLKTILKRSVRKTSYWLYQPMFERVTAFHAITVQAMDLLTQHLTRLESQLREESLRQSGQYLVTSREAVSGHLYDRLSGVYQEYLSLLLEAHRDCGGHTLVFGSDYMIRLCKRAEVPVVDVPQAYEGNPAEVVPIDQRGLGNLRSLPHDSLSGLAVFEFNLTIDELWEMIRMAAERVRPGGVLVLHSTREGERAFPNALQALTTIGGFVDVETRKYSPAVYGANQGNAEGTDPARRGFAVIGRRPCVL